MNSIHKDILNMAARQLPAPSERTLVVIARRDIANASASLKCVAWLSTANLVGLFALRGEDSIADALMDPMPAGCVRVLDLSKGTINPEVLEAQPNASSLEPLDEKSHY